MYAWPLKQSWMGFVGLTLWDDDKNINLNFFTSAHAMLFALYIFIYIVCSTIHTFHWQQFFYMCGHSLMKSCCRLWKRNLLFDRLFVLICDFTIDQMFHMFILQLGLPYVLFSLSWKWNITFRNWSVGGISFARSLKEMLGMYYTCRLWFWRELFTLGWWFSIKAN